MLSHHHLTKEERVLARVAESVIGGLGIRARRPGLWSSCSHSLGYEGGGGGGGGKTILGTAATQQPIDDGKP